MEGPVIQESAKIEHVYALLRQMARSLMRGERNGHTLSPTAVVHEAAARLLARTERSRSRAQMIAAVGTEMRRVLIDYARSRNTDKRNPSRLRVAIELSDAEGRGLRVPDLVAMDEAMKDLAAVEPRQEQVVNMKVFGGMTNDEIAAEIGISESSVERDWKAAKAWLAARLSAPPGREETR